MSDDTEKLIVGRINAYLVTGGYPEAILDLLLDCCDAFEAIEQKRREAEEELRNILAIPAVTDALEKLSAALLREKP